MNLNFCDSSLFPSKSKQIESKLDRLKLDNSKKKKLLDVSKNIHKSTSIYKSYYSKCKKNLKSHEKNGKEKAKKTFIKKPKITAKVVSVGKSLLEMEEKIASNRWKFTTTNFLSKS